MSRYSWFKIKSGGTVIHFDPGYAGYFENQGIPLAELEEKADIILISHPHKDHMQLEAIEMIADENTLLIAPRSCDDKKGRDHKVVEPMDSVKKGGVKITAVDAYNTPEGHSTRKMHHKGEAVGYLVNIGSKRIYFAGDTDLITEMGRLGSVDIAFLPIGGTFVMDIEEAVEAVKIIRPSIVIPMHQSKNDQREFLKEVSVETDSSALILNVGDTIEF
jgi:L-ascorbate metabolism protein UlaG (beta-lactamase superfamily)